MSKALVIKGTNFYNNRLAQVTLSEINPCTGLAISQASHEFSAIGETYQLTATPTPSDTTDQVIWTSSNPDVATVANGLVTTHGVGTAQITASCGTQTATCTITSSHTIYNSAIWMNNGYELSGYNASSSPVKDYFSQYATTRVRTCAAINNDTDGYNAIVSYPSAYAIPIPSGATKVKVTCPNQFTSAVVGYVNSLSHPTNTATWDIQDAAKALALKTGIAISNGSFEHTFDKTVSGANGFVFHLKTGSSDTPASGVTGDVTIMIS